MPPEVARLPPFAMPTREQNDRATENRALALVKLYDKGHHDVFDSGLRKWLAEVDGDEEVMLAEIPTTATQQALWGAILDRREVQEGRDG